MKSEKTATLFPVLCKNFIFITIFCLSIAFCLSGQCDAADKVPYKIGFVGGLTGRSSDIGIQGRNGAMIAVEEINEKGGINGRALELISKDDRQDPETALSVDRQLIEEGVIAIVGHMTSVMAEAVLPLINERRMLMISPTVSTDKLTGIDDYFLRVVNPNVSISVFEAAYAFDKANLRRVAAVCDLSNRVYTEGYVAAFKGEFERLGGKIVSVSSFTTGQNVSFRSIAEEMLREKPDGLLIAAGATDTAMISQHIRMAGTGIPIFMCGWAQTPDLLRHGGPAVEGVIGAMYIDFFNTDKAFLDFKDRFKNRFGGDGPTFAAIFSYEAVMVLKEALLQNPDPRQLKETILKQKTFRGLQGTFEMDAYGDTRRTANIINVSGNQFRIIGQ